MKGSFAVAPCILEDTFLLGKSGFPRLKLAEVRTAMIQAADRGQA